jgi:hypothetical protein
MLHRTSARCLALALLCAGAPAFAADPPKAAPATAPTARDPIDDVFRQGLAAYDAGRLDEAERLFQQAWAVKKTHDIASNLGVVELLRGKPRDAAEHITWALQHWPPTESAKMRKGLEGELQKARLQVGALRVRVNVDGADVLVNGRVVGKSPIADELFVDPGAVKVEARLDGYTPAGQSVQLGKGDTREVALELTPDAVPPQRRSVVPGAVLGGVAGAALVTGIGLFAGGRAKGASGASERDAILAAHHSCVMGASNYDGRCPDVESTATAANTFQKAGVGLMVGAGAVAVGTVLYFVLPTPGSGAGAKSGGLRVSPTLSLNGGGVVLSGAF